MGMVNSERSWSSALESAGMVEKPVITEPPEGTEPENPTPENDSKPETGSKTDPEALPPEGTEPEAPEDEEQGADEGGKPDAENKPQLSREERARNAARRRAEEMRLATEEIRKEMHAEMEKGLDGIVANMRLTDPETGKPITTKAEYDAFVVANDKRSAAEEIERFGLDPAVIDKLVSTHPDVIRAKELAQMAETETTHAYEMSAEERSKQQLAEIQKIDPEVKTLEELIAKDKYPQMRELVTKGVSMSDAYFLTYREELLQRNTQAAMQQATNLAAGKDHLQSSQSHGADSLKVPADVAKGFRLAYGNISESEIQKKYERVIKAQMKKG